MSRLHGFMTAGIAIVWAVFALALAGARPASADIFGQISLASAGTLGPGPQQQGEFAHDSVISTDGAYVVFDGSVGGQTGVWRVDLATSEIQQVAGGDALLPSVSADGRYISFTTNQSESDLAGDTRGLENEPPTSELPGPAGPENVYVRDMNLGPREAGAFTVASAPSGSDEPLTYSEPGTERGAVAAAGAAISADGREVAFVTTAVSNLAGPGTPALQVAVRRLDSRETILVSGEYDGASGQTTETPVSAGGRGAVYGDRYPFPQQVPEYSRWIEARPPGAAISADGTTVAWMGVNVGLQARMLPEESPLPEYTEPLWRRIAAPQTPTERITGGSDPSAPGCAQSGEASLPPQPAGSDPCQGPFLTHPEESEPAVGDSGIWSARGEAKSTPGQFVPRLSADGYAVAFLSRAEPIGEGEFFDQQREKGEQADLYVANMHEGLSRDGALTQVTHLGAVTEAESSAINEFALSENGRDVAFTARRTEFRLAFPALVSPAAAEPGLDEVFYADLENGTLTRVTHGFGGEASEQPHGRKPRETEDIYFEQPTAGATSPSFADGGSLVEFASTASNLVPDDGNGPQIFSALVGTRDGSDAFVVARETPSPLPTPQYISPAPPPPNTEPAWILGATAASRRDGSVVLYVRVPGPGTLSVAARSSLVVTASAPRGRGSRRHGRGRASVHVAIATRTVAAVHAQARAVTGELITLVLRPGHAYEALSERPKGLASSLGLSFSAAGHPSLKQTLQVTFLHPLAKAKSSARSHRSHRRRSR